MEQFKPPKMGEENWRRWEQRFHLYMTATGTSAKEEKVKLAILLHTIGEEALEVYNTLNISLVDDENETMDDALIAFEANAVHKKMSCLRGINSGLIPWQMALQWTDSSQS
ncbi:transcription factor E3 isoform X1 [Tachysurus ichikawai]